MDVELEPQNAVAAEIAAGDLYCVECGYNLRGLTGEVLRCPECGTNNPLTDLAPAASAIQRHIRNMERSLNAAVVMTTLSIVPLMVLLLLSRSYTLRTIASTPAIIIPLAALAALLLGCWVSCMVRFRRLALCSNAWLRSALVYHLWVVPLVLLAGGPIIAMALVLRGFVDMTFRARPPLTYLGLQLVFGLLWIALCAWLAPALRTRLHASIEPLRRESALHITRDYLRERMHRARR